MPLDLKGEKGDPGAPGASAPVAVSPCDSLSEETLRYGDKIDSSDYSFISIKSFPDRHCIGNEQYRWLDYQPSLKLGASAPATQVAFEESLCKKAFALAIVNDYYKWKGGGSYFLLVKNGNMSGKLRRAILCDPDMYGVSIMFPGS